MSLTYGMFPTNLTVNSLPHIRKEGSKEKGIPKYLTMILGPVQFQPILLNQLGATFNQPMTKDL